jgi:hypothetical protein
VTLILLLTTDAGTRCATDGPVLEVTREAADLHPPHAAGRAVPPDLTAGPGLQVDGDLALLLAVGDSTGPRSVRVTLPREPGDGLDWQTAGWGELHRVAEGEAHLSARTLLAVGRIDEAEADEHLWSAALRDDPAADTGQILSPDAIVGPATWPRTDAQRAIDGESAFVGAEGVQPAIEGAPYPVLIGRPGQGIPYRITGAGLIETAAPAAPALLVETSSSTTALSDHRLLISAGRIDAATVRRFSTDQNGAPTAEDCAVEVAHDRQGRVVSVVSPGAALDVPTEDAESWIAIPSGDGIASPYGPGPLRRADHVLRWALDRSTLRLDRRQLPRLSALAAYQLDVAIFAQVGAWDWLRSQVLPHLPIAVATGPAGLYLWPRLPVLRRDLAHRRLEVGVNAARLSPVLAAPLDPVARVTVGYALDARAGRTLRRATVADRRRPDEGPEVLPDLWCARAVAGGCPTSATLALDCPVTSDPTTAALIAQDASRTANRPTYSTVLGAREAEVEGLLPGDVVEVLDARLSLAVAAQVERVGYAGGAAELTVRWSAALGVEP